MGTLSLWTIEHLERRCADMSGRDIFAVGNPDIFWRLQMTKFEYNDLYDRLVYGHDADL